MERWPALLYRLVPKVCVYIPSCKMQIRLCTHKTHINERSRSAPMVGIAMKKLIQVMHTSLRGQG